MTRHTNGTIGDTPSDEVLVAYADGELNDEDAAEVEAAIAGDPAAAERLRDLVAVAELARRAFEGSVTEPVPQALVDAVRQTPASPRSDVLPFVGSTRRRLRGWQPAAIAAALALVVAGTALVSWPQAEGLTREAQIALSETAGYTAVELQDGTLTVLSSFRAVDGRFCREFEVLGQDRLRHALACRPVPAESWSLVTAHETAVTDVEDGSFRPAEGAAPDPVAKAISGLRDGPFMGPEEERRALEELPTNP